MSRLDNVFEPVKTGYTTDEFAGESGIVLLDGQNPKTSLDRIFDYVNKHPTPAASLLYQVLKYSGIGAADAMSLFLFTDIAFTASNCDLTMKNSGCNQLNLALSLFGNNIANAVVGYNTARLGVEYFEYRKIPEDLKAFFSDFKGSTAESVKTVLVAVVAIIAAFPMAAPLMLRLSKKHPDGLSLTAFIFTLVSNGFFDLLPTYILADVLLNNPVILGVMALSMPVISAPIFLGVMSFKLWTHHNLTPDERIINQMKEIRNNYVKEKLNVYLNELEDFRQLVAHETFKNSRRLSPVAQFPEELNGPLTPQKIKNFMNTHQEALQQIKPSAGYGWTKFGIGVLATIATAIGFDGYTWDTIAATASFFASCSNSTLLNASFLNVTRCDQLSQAQLLSTLSGWEWGVASQLALPSICIMSVMLVFFSRISIYRAVDNLTLKFTDSKGFQARPKTATLMSLVGIGICSFSRYTAEYLVTEMKSVIKEWYGDAAENIFGGISFNMARYVSWTINWASWMMTSDAILLKLMESGIPDEVAYAMLMKKITHLKGILPHMNLKDFADSVGIRWIPDEVLLLTSLEELRTHYPEELPKKSKRKCCEFFKRPKNEEAQDLLGSENSTLNN